MLSVLSSYQLDIQMRHCVTYSLLIAVIVVVTGCNKEPVLLKAKGKLLKGGVAFNAEEEDVGVQIAFVPVAADGSPPRNWYIAKVDQKTGTFVASGGHQKGMPPGKYKVAVELKRDRKDTLNGKFDALHTPFEFEVDEKSAEMVIDLEDNSAVASEPAADKTQSN